MLKPQLIAVSVSIVIYLTESDQILNLFNRTSVYSNSPKVWSLYLQQLINKMLERIKISFYQNKFQRLFLTQANGVNKFVLYTRANVTVSERPTERYEKCTCEEGRHICLDYEFEYFRQRRDTPEPIDIVLPNYFLSKVIICNVVKQASGQLNTAPFAEYAAENICIHQRGWFFFPAKEHSIKFVVKSLSLAADCTSYLAFWDVKLQKSLYYYFGKKSNF